MKGVVFTEFIEMVETLFSPDFADQVIEAVTPRSGGAYTSVGTYDHQELVAMVIELSKLTGLAVPELLRRFGCHLLNSFVAQYPQLFTGYSDTFSFLEQVDGNIHTEVRKLYPDAELPRFETRRITEGEFEMIYTSKRRFEDLALGLLEASILHFNESITIARSPGSDSTIFRLTRS